MSPIVPVRPLQLSVRFAIFTVCLICFLIPGRALAGIDAPGWVSFDFLAEENMVYQEITAFDDQAEFSKTRIDAYFNSNASEFGNSGVLIWAGLELSSPAGPRYAGLLIDLDLDQVPSNGDYPLPISAVRAEYFEKQDDRILFWGTPVYGDISVSDSFDQAGDKGGVEGFFDLIFSDPNDEYPGCRVFLRGHFSTEPAPSILRNEINYVDNDDDYYVEEEYGGGCSGEEAEVAAGCTEIFLEGCGAAMSGIDCEGDSGDGAGCEGDTYEASLTGRRRGHPLRTLTRVIPQIGVVVFIRWIRRSKLRRK
ncbi:MAG: hypothetical protein JRJ87_06250 [Deltaproteobacteria bacterium]|nr:hypothetical protein [Deltaproteobacteria bacterium]